MYGFDGVRGVEDIYGFVEAGAPELEGLYSAKKFDALLRDGVDLGACFACPGFQT